MLLHRSTDVSASWQMRNMMWQKTISKILTEYDLVKPQELFAIWRKLRFNAKILHFSGKYILVENFTILSTQKSCTVNVEKNEMIYLKEGRPVQMKARKLETMAPCVANKEESLCRELAVERHVSRSNPTFQLGQLLGKILDIVY